MSDPTYAPVSKSAVWSALLGVASIAGLIEPALALLALLSVMTGLAALSSIGRYQLMGRPLAVVGLAASITFAAITPAWHAVRFKLEVARFKEESPPDYERIDFAAVTRVPQITEPTSAGLSQYVGRKVCLKGYSVPKDRFDLSAWYLSPNGETRRSVIVRLASGEEFTDAPGALAVSGILQHNPEAANDPNAPKFILEQSQVRNSSSRFQLAGRIGGDC